LWPELNLKFPLSNCFFENTNTHSHTQTDAETDASQSASAINDPMEEHRIERWKEEVAAKILKAIGRTKPPTVKPQDLEKFLPLADELRLDKKFVSDDTSSNESIKRKKIFVALNEALTSVGGSFPIRKPKFQDTEILDGELIIKLQKAISPLSVLITNTWNSETVKDDLPFQGMAHRVFLHPAFFPRSGSCQRNSSHISCDKN